MSGIIAEFSKHKMESQDLFRPVAVLGVLGHNLAVKKRFHLFRKVEPLVEGRFFECYRIVTGVGAL